MTPSAINNVFLDAAPYWAKSSLRDERSDRSNPTRSTLQTGVCSSSRAFFNSTISGRSTSIQRMFDGRSIRYGLVSKPAPRFKTVSTPVCSASMISRSIADVRTTTPHATAADLGKARAIFRPRSPARIAANRSWTIASALSASFARIDAIQRAVSATLRIAASALIRILPKTDG